MSLQMPAVHPSHLPLADFWYSARRIVGQGIWNGRIFLLVGGGGNLWIFFGGGQWIGLSQEEQAVGSVKTVSVDNVDNGEENFPGIVIINLFCGEMSKSIVF